MDTVTDELWTVQQVAAHLAHTRPGSTRRWLATHGVEARSRDVESGAKLYRADEVRAVVRRPSGRPRTRSTTHDRTEPRDDVPPG